MGSQQINITDFSLTDRISDLPSNIIECILYRLPISDAVATSILSKEWRHKWTKIPNLVFDNEFYDGIRSRSKIRMPIEYSNIIGKILLLHAGPIHKFVLRTPLFRDDFHVDLVSWMHFISRKDVKELTIQDRYAEIKLPSYIFNCSELQSLKIHVCGLDLHPPQDFGGFCNLRRLYLIGLLNGTQISDLVSKCPLLERLKIHSIAKGHTLVIDAPRLLSLCVRLPLNTLLRLKNVESLNVISLLFGPLGTKKFCELFDIFGSLSNVRSVTLSSLRTTNDMPRDAPMSLPTTLHNHRCLTLLEIDISSPQCIHFILGIFKSSPNLQKLNVGIRPSADIREVAALHFLDTQIREHQTLNSLVTVKIKVLLGKRFEIMFIKLILSCAPILETMYLTGYMVNEVELTLMSELLTCGRSSPQAKWIAEMGSKLIITDSSLPDDRISYLPSDIINCILDRLPICDAAATSILSKEWRHKWRTIGNLIFDEEFAGNVTRNWTEDVGERMVNLEYSNIIDRILLLHIGPIRKFVLQSPILRYSLPFDIISSWILFISQNEVKELIIEAPYEPIRLPSYLFHCNELQHLKIHVKTLILHPPNNSRGFCNLISLDLSLLHDGGVISNFISECPLLERLSLDVAYLTHPLVIDAPRLRFLHAFHGEDADVLLILKNVHCVTELSLEFYSGVTDFCYLISIFGSVPKVETVILDLPHTLVDMPPDPPVSLPTTLHNHKKLTIVDIDISYMESMSFILFLLCRSPNLRKLNLGIYSSATNVDEETLHSLDALITEPLVLNSLLTIKLKGLLGSEVEILFIKLIISCSTVLKTLHLCGAKNLHNQAEFRLITELLQCPRPSCQAQVIYSKHPGDRSIFDF
ncbi:unnamed protein product [Rhodiola kirilowii]